MPRKIPSYRLHRPTGLAVVTLDRHDFYLGRHGSPESRAEYDRRVAEWLSRRAAATSATSTGPPNLAALTVVEVLKAFWDHAQQHYRLVDGQPSDELGNIKAALRPVRELYGRTLAADFGPLALRAVRERMVGAGLARPTVNARVNRIRRVFKWAASVELVPVAVPQALATVAGLQRGRTDAPEPKPVGPVPPEVVERTLPFLPRAVAAMVRLQMFTGMRPREVCEVRGLDLHPGSPTWTYEPARHKTAWRGKRRVIPIGPKGQAILAEFARDDPADYLFDPRATVAAQHAERTQARRTKPTPSARAKRVARPGANHARAYDRTSYRRAICRACDRAFPHPELSAIPKQDLTPEQAAELKTWRRAHHWSPNRLRHLVATEVRARFGLEAAQTVLGHSKADVTQVYAERDIARARDVIGEIG